MLYPKLYLGLAVFVGGLAASPASACGPDFPESLLAQREETLLEGPVGNFAVAVRKLVPPPILGCTRGETTIDPDASVEERRVVAEGIGLESIAEAAAKIAAMRAGRDGDEAYAAGSGLPESVRLYTAAAVDFRRAVPPRDQEDPPRVEPREVEPALGLAQSRFEAVLALAPDGMRLRGVWAAFMLGRIAVERGDLSSADRRFEQTRALVGSGLPDPLGLAMESLGEQALGHLNAGDIAGAVALYLQQASCGSESAVNSLRRAARKALAEDRLLDAAVADPQTRTLILLHTFTHGLPEADSPIEEASEEVAGEAEAEPEAPADRDSVVLRKIADALERAGAAGVEGSDWLAAAAYRRAQYDLAGRLAARGSSALAHWIRAKLAMRQGDPTLALASYAEAVRLFPPDLPAPTPEPGQEGMAGEPESELEADFRVERVMAEDGIVRLAKGEYVGALSRLLGAAATYWIDAAYVAERVLSLDELKSFVDEHVTRTSPAPGLSSPYVDGAPPGQRLRSLLARRLVRAGRVDEALVYFDDEDLRKRAEQYCRAVGRANRSWQGRVTRAQAWFEAALVLRFEGMELAAFEGAPDYAMAEGYYGDIYPELYGWVDPWEVDADAAAEAARSESAEAAPADGVEDQPGAQAYVTDEEKARVAATRAQPETRFHYRGVAAAQAAKAADLLPRSSQAFAAVLCHATAWLIDREPAAAKEIYQRYLEEGPYVAWGQSFGRRCPAPNFSRAKRRVWAERVDGVYGFCRAHPAGSLGLAGVLAVLGAACGWWLWHRPRSRREHDSLE